MHEAVNFGDVSSNLTYGAKTDYFFMFYQKKGYNILSYTLFGGQK
jgi:hypothetical protein